MKGGVSGRYVRGPRAAVRPSNGWKNVSVGGNSSFTNGFVISAAWSAALTPSSRLPMPSGGVAGPVTSSVRGAERIAPRIIEPSTAGKVGDRLGRGRPRRERTKSCDPHKGRGQHAGNSTLHVAPPSAVSANATPAATGHKRSSPETPGRSMEAVLRRRRPDPPAVPHRLCPADSHIQHGSVSRSGRSPTTTELNRGRHRLPDDPLWICVPSCRFGQQRITFDYRHGGSEAHSGHVYQERSAIVGCEPTNRTGADRRC